MNIDDFLQTGREDENKNMRMSEADFRKLVLKYKDLEGLETGVKKLETKIKELEQINKIYLRVIDKLTKAKEC